MGFALLVLAYVALIGSCFAFAIFEIRRPVDPGPLQIDIKRDIDNRHFASALRNGRRDENGVPAIEFAGINVAVDVAGSMSVAGNEDHPAAYVVRGNGTLGPSSNVDAFICDGVAVIGAGAVVAKHAEGATALILGPRARVEGRATSAGCVRLAPGSAVKFASAPLILTEGTRGDGTVWAPRDWPEDLEAHLDRLVASGTSFDWALRELSWKSDPEAAPLSGVEALLRAEARGATAIGEAAAALARSWAPGGEAWYLGAGTARVRGDLHLPDGAMVPFHLIVEGSLHAGAGVQFHGGIHTWGDAKLSIGCAVFGSVTARRAVALGAGSYVSECVFASADAWVGAGTSIGNERSGGLTSSGTIRLGGGVLVRGKLYAESGAEVLPAAFSPHV